MSVSVIAVPRRATLYDVVQHAMCVDRLGLQQHTDPSASSSSYAARRGEGFSGVTGIGGTLRIPSDRQFWQSLRLAVKQHPEATQSLHTRMLRLHDSATNETIVIGQDFLKDFVAVYEAHATYEVTVAAAQQATSAGSPSAAAATGAGKAIGMRTFSCNQEFWDHVLLAYASTVSGGGSGIVVAGSGGSFASSGSSSEPPAGSAASSSPARHLDNAVVSIRIARVEHRHLNGDGMGGAGPTTSTATVSTAFSRKVPTWLQNLATLQMTVGEWNGIVAVWNTLHMQRDAQEQQRQEDAAAALEDGQAATGAGGDPVDEGRQRSHAVFASDTSFDFVAEARRRLDEVTRQRGEGRGAHGAGPGGKQGGAYWTHFMRHWALLEAQYRNYL